MTQEKKEKQGKGAPSKYKPEYCQMLIDHVTQGMSFETFGVDLKVNRDTLQEWAKVHPDFSEAKKNAYDASFKFWERVGFAGMSGKIKNFNAAVWIFSMKNRFKWTDKVEIGGQENATPIVFNYKL